MKRSAVPVFLSAVVLVVLGTAGSAFGQRDLKVIPAPDPELERATFKLPEGFEVNLFAADPKIAKPIQMNFDEAGRLWIVSSEVYPHIEPGAAASDRVLVLEDTDRDGVSDQTHVFAEGLLIPTGIAPGDGGAYVANSTELLHFADDDGDLRADSRRIVLSGFGTEDTHHILHTLRWGPEGYLYLNQSIYIHSHVETPWGVRRLNAGGIWQFRPDTLELGVFMRGLVNSWGHHFDRYGQSFATDGAGGEGINYVIPGAYYFTAADAPKILHGLNPGSPKHCGLEIVETPMLPESWQGSAITNDFRGHRVCRFTLSDNGSGYVSREQQEVIWSDHVAFRPIDVKLGPDGAIYIADWYNPIIQHGEVDFRDPRRDHTHGRIWRVTWTGAPEREPVDLTAMSSQQLFEQLASPDGYRRHTARQLLRQRDGDLIPELRDWLANAQTAQSDHVRLEALWVFQAAGVIEPPLLRELLQSDQGKIRAAAVRVLSHWKFQVPESQSLLAELVNDEHPQVRLEATRALSFSPNSDSEFLRALAAAKTTQQQDRIRQLKTDPARINLALQATDHPTDVFLDYAIWLTTRELADVWLPAFREGDLQFQNVDHLLTAFAAIGQGAPVDLLIRQLSQPSVTAQQKQQLTSLILAGGTPQQLNEFINAAPLQSDAEILQQALNQTRDKGLRLNLNPQATTQLLQAEHPAVRQATLRAVGQWRLNSYQTILTSTATSAEASEQDRRASLEGMLLSGDSQLLDQLLQFAADSEQPAGLRLHAVAVLASKQTQRAAGQAARLLPELQAADRPGDLAAAFLSLKNGEQALAQALKDSTLDSDVARDLLRAIREAGQAAPQLEQVVRRIGNVTGRRELTAEQRQQLLTLAMESSSPAAGESIFRNEQFGCLKCHAIGGVGGQVGPDMVSLGGSAQPDYLLDSLLNPNAKVKENYHTVIVVTTDGKLQSGIQVQQSEQAVVLRNAEDQLIEIARSDIEEIVPGLSLMPEGLVDALTDAELAALVRFLSELGRTPEYSLDRRELARTWQVMAATDEAAYRLRRTSYAQAAVDDPAFSWRPAYSTVAGSLPLADVPVVSVRNRSAAGERGVGFAKCWLTVQTAGDVALKLNDITGLELRINEAPVDLTPTITIPLDAGRHRLTFTIDDSNRSTPLQLELLPEQTTAVATFDKSL